MVSFTEPEKLTLIFDGENRQEWQNTSYILDELNIKTGDIIADIGAGTGYFCQQFIDNTCADKIYAIDSEPNMVSYLGKRFDGESKITCLLSEANNPMVPAECNVVFIANCYRFIMDRTTFLSNLKLQIDIDTKVFIIDFKGDTARVTPEMAIQEIIGSGFTIQSYDRAGCPDHYILSFQIKK